MQEDGRNGGERRRIRVKGIAGKFEENGVDNDLPHIIESSWIFGLI